MMTVHLRCDAAGALGAIAGIKAAIDRDPSRDDILGLIEQSKDAFIAEMNVDSEGIIIVRLNPSDRLAALLLAIEISEGQ